MSDLEASIHARLTEIEHGLHAKIDAFGRATVLALKHLIEENPMSAAYDAVKADVADLSAEIDQLISAKADADAKAAAQDEAAANDIRSSLDAIKSKVTAALAPADQSGASSGSSDTSGSSSASAPTTVTVSQPVSAPSTVVPVTADAPVPVGATVSGPGIADGTTVAASDAGSVTLSQPTTDDHQGGETLVVQPAPASGDVTAQSGV